MGYILPMDDFQASQYIRRSLSTSEPYSYIHNVHGIKKESRFGRRQEKRTKHSDLKYWERKNSVYNALHTSSYDKGMANVTGKGLNYNFYV
ncbi:hypothetical protein ACIQ4I_07270 [Rummeliibacillus sp. NPDC094406]|uniref:hypothetical protein n=1 Tax=Rummeliibacillus sp. NPDC094406 TaxID=3364511 RepID=UPI00380B5A83